MNFWKSQETPNASRARAADPHWKTVGLPALKLMNLHNTALTVRNSATTPITLKRLANLNLSCGFVLLYPRSPNGFVDLGFLIGLQHEFPINSN